MGWSIGKGGSVFYTRLGQELELPVTSPKEVVKVAWEEWQAGLFDHQCTRLAPRRILMGGHEEAGWCHQLVKDLVHTRGFDGRCRALSLQLLSGTVPTAAWLQAQGWKSECRCGRVQPDTLQHRLGG